MANEQNLEKHKFVKGKVDREEARKNGKKGAEARAKAIKERKTIAEILEMWTNNSLKDSDKAKLQSLGIDAETNKALLVIPLIKQISKGDVKALNMAMQLLGEDKEREEKIKKLELENELLRKELKGEYIEEKIVVISDVGKDE